MCKCLTFCLDLIEALSEIYLLAFCINTVYSQAITLQAFIQLLQTDEEDVCVEVAMLSSATKVYFV